MLVGPYAKGQSCPRCGNMMFQSTCASFDEFSEFAYRENLKLHFDVHPSEFTEDSTRDNLKLRRVHPGK